MKTIEERAKEYAPDPFLAALERKAYFAGAKDQQYIDRLLIEQLIDKACEWLKARNVLTDASIEEFRKAMEE